jgi:hypothetical protein
VLVIKEGAELLDVYWLSFDASGIRNIVLVTLQRLIELGCSREVPVDLIRSQVKKFGSEGKSCGT